MLRKLDTKLFVKWRMKHADVLKCRKAWFQNHVMSEDLAMLERRCENYCFVPRVPKRKVAVIGAGSDVGRIASLMLKQQKVIQTLALYEEVVERRLMGLAHDIAHIDTSTEVEAYQGRKFLKDALEEAEVVLICGGSYPLPPCCFLPEHQLFHRNLQHVRTVTVACAKFCPHAVIAVQTPPVDCNFALCMHTLKKLGTYNRRRVLGVNAVNSMRANQLLSTLVGGDPSTGTVPVVGGTGRCTRVPVFSVQKKAASIPQPQLDCLTRLVRDADEIICKVKSNTEQGHLSIGFSTARFIISIMQGLFEGRGSIDSALVEQADPGKCYGMQVCCTPVTLGPAGIAEYLVPQLNAREAELLEAAKCDLEDMLNLGRCYALGEEYYLHPCKCIPPPPCTPCPVCIDQVKRKN